jgi:hypothetical protein
MFVPGAKIPLSTPPACRPIPEGSRRLGMGPEIKHDGYRLIARRDGNRVWLYTRLGYYWSGKYPRIVESLREWRNVCSSYIADNIEFTPAPIRTSRREGLFPLQKHVAPNRSYVRI